MSVGGTIAVACALALFLVMCFGWLARRSFKKFEREAELNAPLIECVTGQWATVQPGFLARRINAWMQR
ncbi:hypothetical protein GQ600_15297 [Phytophthora cactorum]|nr:hypothetical protein GQ600_15297 [Phytophthora cactorum]